MVKSPNGAAKSRHLTTPWSRALTGLAHERRRALHRVAHYVELQDSYSAVPFADHVASIEASALNLLAADYRTDLVGFAPPLNKPARSLSSKGSKREIRFASPQDALC